MNAIFENCQKLVIKYMITMKKILKIHHLYFKKEGDYSEKNKCYNEVFPFTILHRKKLNTFTLQLLIYYI